MGSETLRAMRALATNPHIAHPDSAFSKIPALFLIGSADRVVCQRQGARFFDRLASRDKHIKVFHGLYHCLLEDPEKDDVIRSNLSESVWFPGTTRHSSLSKPCVARASAGMDSRPARHLPPSDSTPDSKASSTPDGKSIVLLTPDKASGKTKRKTKRLVWTDELHFRFVSAVFELGVKNASPKALLALMETKNPTEGLTAEHIKSHLQKYRINYELRNDHVAAQPPPPGVDAQENTDAVDGMDLASWGRLSLTVDPDDDDIFGFLRS
ncbi:Two-component response regulator ARR18 [Phytophthora cinnamomi]|uniref:Two-component response regulator ARR18 n=1 Tax=Phytophthora cinnamomi TaxID=4785 RepID=UPI003559C83D|nr:Two-component response regulator ARR18 [Phytophthora cinnamomi]